MEARFSVYLVAITHVSLHTIIFGITPLLFDVDRDGSESEEAAGRQTETDEMTACMSTLYNR